MSSHIDKTKNIRSQSVNGGVLQNKSGKSNVQFFDKRPEIVAQMKLQEIVNNSRVAQLTVMQSTAPWGDSKDKWYTDIVPAADRKYYDTQEEAQAAEDQILQEKADAEAKAWYDATWDIIDSAGNHFDDGWGELYGITSIGDLQAVIEQNDNDEDDGEHKIELGKFGHVDEHLVRPCTIVYRVRHEEVNISGEVRNLKIREVFHCGPSDL